MKPCKLWRGAPDAYGYGRIKIENTTGKAHRFAYRVYHNLLDSEMPQVVCHACDTRLCIEETHLFPGTATDNRDDCVWKQRHAFGERSGASKLTEDEVRAIRAEYAAGVLTQTQLGIKYDVTQGVISSVVRRATWKHVN